MPPLYEPDGHWLTDTFVFPHDGVYHAFSGIARRQAAWNWGHDGMSIGHAISTDLVHWQDRGVALEPTGGDAFDSLAVNVGCVLEHDDRFYLFYWTRRKQDAVPFIGLAISDDLEHWDRAMDRPVIDADPRWYETEIIADDAGGIHGSGLRDPYVWLDEDDGRYHMTFASRVNEGPLDGRGCVGQAVSDDLLTWTCTEPLLAPGYYSEMEVPQVFSLGGRWYVHFHTNMTIWMSVKGRREIPDHDQIPAHFYWMADHPAGPWERPREHVLAGSGGHICNPLAVRVLDDFAGNPTVIHFHMARANRDDDGPDEPGPLALPKTLGTTADGLLTSGMHPAVEERMQPGSGRPGTAFVAEVTLTPDPHAGNGIILWDAYRLLLVGDGLALHRIRDNKVIAHRPLPSLPAGDTTLQVVACDAYLDMFLDGRWLLTAPAYERQSDAIRAMPEGGREVQVRNLCLA